MLPSNEPRQRVIRVFISSTFRDMQEDRDILIKQIFPQLRKMCEERAVAWNEVDLRWGIDDEQKAEGNVLPLCLEEIRRCRPYFIGILGERYGWVPEPDSIPEDLLEAQPWLKQHLRHSVTELEILHGVFAEEPMRGRAYFYFRDPKYLESVPADRRKDFTAENAEAALKLQKLKQKLRDARATKVCELREPYENPKQLGDWILEDFTRLINQLYPKNQTPEPLDQEAARHEAYARNRRLAFVGREELLRRLDEHAAAQRGPLVLTGEPGCGKSALLAEWVARWSAGRPDEFFIQHYIGSTPDSADWQGLVRRILGVLNRVLAISDEIPVQAAALRGALGEWAAKAAGARRVVLVLDAVNQLAEDGAARQLSWLPTVFPANFRVLVSSAPGESLDALHERGWTELTVPLFSQSEIAPATLAYFRLFGKTPPAEVVATLESTPAAANALYLRAVLDELRQFGKHEELQAKAAHYLSSRDLPELFGRILGRWHDDFGDETGHPDLVRRALCLIACARFGLSEAELLELLGNNGEPMPRRFWTPFYLAAENAFVLRVGLLNLGHEHLRAAVQKRWLDETGVVNTFHNQMAGYFSRLSDAGPVRIVAMDWGWSIEVRNPASRKVDELPTLLAKLRRWERLRDFVSDVPAFLCMFAEDRWKHDLHGFWIPLRKHYIPGDTYGRMLAAFEAADADTEKVSFVLTAIALFHYEEANYALAEPLFARVLNFMEDSQAGAGPTINALHHLTMVLQETGRLDEAEILCRRALALSQQEGLGLGRRNVARSLNNLAVLFQNTDRPAIAELLYRRAIAIDEAVPGAGDHDIAVHLSNLAVLLKKMDRFSEAEPMIRRALAIDERNLGPSHPNVAIRLGNLAELLESTNRKVEAEPLMRRALAIDDGIFGLHHPKVAADLNNLAGLLQDTNRLAEAERMFRRALQTREETLGPDHINVGESLHNLARLLKVTKQLSEAERLYRRALEIEEKHDGPASTRVADTLDSLAELLRSEDRLADAGPLFYRALTIRKQRLGPKHHKVAESCNNLSLLLRDMNRLTEAEEFTREALAGYEASLGPNHPEVAVVLSNLAGLLRITNRPAEVEALYSRALSIIETSPGFGPRHPRAARYLNNLALFYKLTNRLAEAEPLFRRALEIDESSYGPNNPEVATVLNNLAMLLMAMNRMAEAEPMLRRALDIDGRGSGPDHPKTAIRLCSLADLLGDTNRLAEAEMLQRRAVGILLRSSARNRREHPELRGAIAGYAALLGRMGRGPAEIVARINELVELHGNDNSQEAG
jgi:nephrocystin-3